MSDKIKTTRELPKPVNTVQALEEALDILSMLHPVLIGGVALSFYGIERYTKDVDFALTQAEVSAAALLVQDKDPKPLRIGGLSFATKFGVRVDLIDHRFDYKALFEEAIQAAQHAELRAKVGSREVLVIPIHYFIALKLVADRPQDEADLAKLLPRSDLDYPAAREIVHRHVGLFAARRLDRLARLASRSDAPKEHSDEEES